MQTSKQPEFKITPPVKKEIIKIVDERIREAHVTKKDFSELKGIVKRARRGSEKTCRGPKKNRATIRTI